jgi:hypothetical protein
MSASDAMAFRARIMSYKRSYDQDRDSSRYFSKTAAAALNLWLAEQNEFRARMGKAGLVLPTALSASSPLFMAAIDTVANAIDCPVDERMSALQFLNHFGNQVANRYDSEYAEPVRKALKVVSDSLRSLGLVN